MGGMDLTVMPPIYFNMKAFGIERCNMMIKETQPDTFINGELNPVMYILHDDIKEFKTPDGSKDKLYMLNENGRIHILSACNNLEVSFEAYGDIPLKYELSDKWSFENKKGKLYRVRAVPTVGAQNFIDFEIASIYITRNFESAKVNSGFDLKIKELRPETNRINKILNFMETINPNLIMFFPVFSMIITIISMVLRSLWG